MPLHRNIRLDPEVIAVLYRYPEIRRRGGLQHLINSLLRQYRDRRVIKDPPKLPQVKLEDLMEETK